MGNAKQGQVLTVNQKAYTGASITEGLCAHSSTSPVPVLGAGFSLGQARMAKLTASATYTDAELLDLYRDAFANISQGKSYTIGTRQLTRQDLPEVRETIEWLESRIDASTSASNRNALARFNRPA